MSFILPRKPERASAADVHAEVRIFSIRAWLCAGGLELGGDAHSGAPRRQGGWGRD